MTQGSHQLGSSHMGSCLCLAVKNLAASRKVPLAPFLGTRCPDVDLWEDCQWASGSQSWQRQNYGHPWHVGLPRAVLFRELVLHSL